MLQNINQINLNPLTIISHSFIECGIYKKVINNSILIITLITEISKWCQSVLIDDTSNKDSIDDFAISKALKSQNLQNAQYKIFFKNCDWLPLPTLFYGTKAQSICEIRLFPIRLFRQQLKLNNHFCNLFSLVPNVLR